MKRLDAVDGWLSRVEAIEAEIDQLITDSLQQVHSTCLGGCCPKNCWSRYKLGKKVADRLQDVRTLRNKGDFSEVEDKILMPPVDERLGSSTVGLESTFDKVWRCLMEEEVGIIGLCGMAGVRKTTLLTQINNEFLKSSHDFRVVIWVMVSQDLNLEKVQNEIGKKLGFTDESWKSKGQEQKAIDILRILRQKKLVLLLDDIWKRVDLQKLGVPVPQKENWSKLVFTTRFDDVCGKMEVHKKIRVECLPKDKALELFKQKVGEDTLNSHPELPELAERVADECKRLPLALITVGRATSSKKTLEEWNHAIKTLKRYAAEFSGMADEVFARLKFSYDSLRNETLQFCFLYFSLFPEDYRISKSDIIEYWMGEGILGENEDINDARNRAQGIIGSLIHVGLLDSENEDSVRMHDVVRDMAQWISKECEETTSLYCDVVKEGEKWKHVERLSLMDAHILELKVPINCPHLLTLLLKNCSLTKISSDFFQFMPTLRVLDISKNWRLSELPLGISNLVLLEYLNVSFTGIRSLPSELKNLKNLKYLNLAWTTNLEIIPPEVLSSFHMMRALDMTICGNLKEIREGNEALVDELEGLEHIQQLSIALNSNLDLKRFLKSQKLCDFTDSLQLLFLVGSTSLDLPSLQTLKNLRSLSILKCRDVEGFCVDWVLEGQERINQMNKQIINKPCFENLVHFEVFGCQAVKDLTWLIYVPNLQTLSITDCNQLRDVIRPTPGNICKARKSKAIVKAPIAENPQPSNVEEHLWGIPSIPFFRNDNGKRLPKS